MQTQFRLLPSPQDQAQSRRHAREKQLEPGQGLGRVQLVQIVDHQHERVV